MAETALTIAEAVAQRTRDAQYTATPRTDIYTLLSRVQAAWNAHSRRVVTADTAIGLEAACHLYNIATLLPLCARVETVEVNGRLLDMVPWSVMRAAGINWFRQQADSPLQWSMAGRDTLALWPAPRAAATATITYVKHTADVVADTDTTEVPDEEVPAIIDMLEALVATKRGELVQAQQAAARVAERMKLPPLE